MRMYIEDCGCYCGASVQSLTEVAFTCFKVIHNRVGHLQGALYVLAIFIVLTAYLYLLLKVNRNPSLYCTLG